jgi:nitroreductase
MDLIEAMKTTGTCRYYRPGPVPDDVLLRAFDAARFGPQGGNRQPVRFVVVRDPGVKRQLRDWYLVPWKAYLSGTRTGEVAVGAEEAEHARRLVTAADHFAEHLDEVPVLVVVCAELAGLHPTDQELGRLSIVGGGSVYPTVQNFLLACRNEGLGTALTTLLCVYEPQVKDLLGIPDGVATAATLAVGWPARPLPTRLSRRPVSELVFAERYGEPLGA